MPELPDVEVFRRRLDDAVQRRTLAGGAVRDRTVLDQVSAAALRRALTGAEVVGTVRHGKRLYAMTRGGPHLALHFGMTGDLVVGTEGEEPRHTRVVLELSGGQQVFFVDQRKLGRIGVVDDVAADIDRRGLGPDALAIGLDELSSVLRSSRGALKPTLMDQHRLSGLGNIYTDEIFFQARLDPRTEAGTLTVDGLRRLHRQMRRVLTRAVEGGVRDFPRGWLIHHRQEGVECPRGDGQVVRFSSGGRHGYYCPECQQGRR